MSLRTCSWLLPQKEQRYGTLGPLLVLVLVTCPVGSLIAGGLFALGALRLDGRDRLGLLHCALGDLLIMMLGRQGIPLFRVDRVDDAIVLGCLGSHEKVPVRVLDDLFERLPGVARQDLVV